MIGFILAITGPSPLAKKDSSITSIHRPSEAAIMMGQSGYIDLDINTSDEFRKMCGTDTKIIPYHHPSSQFTNKSKESEGETIYKPSWAALGVSTEERDKSIIEKTAPLIHLKSRTPINENDMNKAQPIHSITPIFSAIPIVSDTTA